MVQHFHCALWLKTLLWELSCSDKYLSTNLYMHESSWTQTSELDCTENIYLTRFHAVSCRSHAELPYRLPFSIFYLTNIAFTDRDNLNWTVSVCFTNGKTCSKITVMDFDAVSYHDLFIRSILHHRSWWIEWNNKHKIRIIINPNIHSENMFLPHGEDMQWYFMFNSQIYKICSVSWKTS